MDLQATLTALAGGALLGIAATVMLGLNGRVTGISGIVGGLVLPGKDMDWRLAFFVGLFGAGLAWTPVLPAAFTAGDRSIATVMIAGLLVGFGTRLGNGCTSGHGICGGWHASPSAPLQRWGCSSRRV